MKTYDKEKMRKYINELLSLCLEKNIKFECTKEFFNVYVYANEIYTSYLTEDLYSLKVNVCTMPIWELIEKVKQL